MAASSNIWILCFMLSVLANGFLPLQASHQSANHSYRTAYHFQPPKNWMNDPNGPMIYKGIYHLFYQYNPKSAIWGNIVWAHSTSTDLVNWDPHPPALVPSQPSDINGCWSGSATILPGGKPAILYTGVDFQVKQYQNLAMPRNMSDPYLKEWVKSPYNPVMSAAPEKLNASSFRDPTTAWLGPDGHWRILVGNERKHVRGMALLYRSQDFVHWQKAKHPLFSLKNTGMWECPDFYPVSIHGENGVLGPGAGAGVKFVLKVSLDDYKHDYYTIGMYDHNRDRFTPETAVFLENGWGLRYDYGKYYASKTFFDSAKNRRVLWGWVNESTGNSTIDLLRGWAGVQAIPRKIWLDESGKQLVQWPVEEIEKLRTNRVGQQPSTTTLLKPGSVVEVSGVTASQADVEITFDVSTVVENAEVVKPKPGGSTNPQELCSQKGASVSGKLGPFGLLVLASKDIQEFTAVFFRIFKDGNKFSVLMCSDQTRSSTKLVYDKTTYGAFLDIDPLKQKLSLRCLIDQSIVESFGEGGKVCITSRVYPSMAIDGEAHLYAFNNGSENIWISSLSAWSMNKARIN
ncbi:PREDICTED: beta-fructofuranosidase, insoluble isoenzyme CWINV1-like [Ipomoea nil]|uniref:beta-fructofuranosidase, insoluble isoenzyme CWINV1-like n=1 Tax=Ipomoea nil TaxID=35883 RepID=UPI00090158B6|nr:PREDICTED: beta-fructofuranosidase, insoluble isoenzyme CWINV1-like [Ipomoea nil]